MKTQAHSVHPRHILLGAQALAVCLPVCDHYCGTQGRMEKSLALQQEMIQERGACVFDVTLDCEDGAPVGAEREHAQMVAHVVAQTTRQQRVAVRVHPVSEPGFAVDVQQIVAHVGARLRHIMLPKVECAADVDQACVAIDAAGGKDIPLHALVESSHAVHQAFEIAAHPRVASLSFGLMDFVSSHAGAIPAQAMGGEGQFTHPLVVRAKLEIAAACHAHGKVPAHCVFTGLNDGAALARAARLARETLGYTRMWSIHPNQIRTIVQTFAPEEAEIEVAASILVAAKAANWAPISYQGSLHDRASYRYYWQVLERAHATAQPLPQGVRHYFVK